MTSIHGIVDTHCHLDFTEFDHDRLTVINRARQAGVSDIVIPGVKRKSWPRVVELAQLQPRLYYALGLHPVFLHEHREQDLVALDQELFEPGAIAVGEIGLDFYQRDLDRERQRTLFREQLHIAGTHNLPVILHVRKAHDETLCELDKTGVAAGIVHAFNGSLQQGLKYVEMGFKLGFGGMLTYEHSRKLRRLAKELPLSSMVLETDAPDMVVSSHRGARNSPEYLPCVLETLSYVRCESAEQIAAATSANAFAVLGLSSQIPATNV